MSLIRENTKVFKILSREHFRSRAETMLSPSGACKALIVKDGRVICGLHPMQNCGEDFRDRTCQKDFLCDTFKKFNSWPSSRQKDFLKFVEAKHLSNYLYSMGMDSGSLLKEFERFHPD